MITGLVILAVCLIALSVGVVFYFLFPITLFKGLMRAGGWTRGIRWRMRNGWPLYEGGSHEQPGDPTIILVHGFGVDNSTMFLLAKELVRTHEISAPDLPGFGLHQIQDDSAMTMDVFVRKLDEFLAAEGYSSVVLVGCSMGGAICASYAAKHHHRVAGLCLIGPAGVKPPYDTHVYEQLQREENALRVDTYEDFQRIFELNFSNPPSIPRPLKKALARRAASRAESQERILRTLSDTLLDGVRPLLGHIRCPTSVVWGGDDAIIHPSVAPHWEQGIQDVEMNLIPGVGHSTMMERPEEVAEVIDRLMERVRKRINRG